MTQASAHRSGRGVLLLVILAVLFVLVPYLFWRQTWFGGRLTDKELSLYLESSARGRRVQHALVQVSERMVAGDKSAQQWYPGLLRAAANPDVAVRTTAAWTMGQDPASDLLHNGLKSLLRDADIQVRRNAALSLVRFRDASGREELVGILRPQEIRATKGGSLQLLVSVGQEVAVGTRVAKLTGDNGEEAPVAPFHGRVFAFLATEGTRVEPGAPMVALSSGAGDVWEALRALYLVGEAEDIPEIERYTRGVPEMPERIARQAALSAAAIRSRLVPSSNR